MRSDCSFSDCAVWKRSKKSDVPDLAIVPRCEVSSASVIPMPESRKCSVFASGFDCTRTRPEHCLLYYEYIYSYVRALSSLSLSLSLCGASNRVYQALAAQLEHQTEHELHAP